MSATTDQVPSAVPASDDMPVRPHERRRRRREELHTGSLPSNSGEATIDRELPHPLARTQSRKLISNEHHAAPSPPPTSVEPPNPRPREGILTKMLEECSRECPLCRAEGLPSHVRAHRLASCSRVNAGLVREESGRLLQWINHELGSCWGCGLPKGFCDRFQSRAKWGQRLSNDRICYAPRVMAPTVISTAIFDTGLFEHIQSLVEGGDAVDLEDAESVYQWFAQEAPFSGMATTRLTAFFYQIQSTPGLCGRDFDGDPAG